MRKTIISALAFLVALSAFAQGEETFLRQLQKRDSVLIADQLSYGAAFAAPEGTVVALPEYKDNVLMQGVESVSAWTIDTLKNKAGNLEMEAAITITSFDEGEYLLPDIRIARLLPGGDTDTLVFKGSKLSVKTMPVDTATFQVHDIRGQIGYPLTFAEILPYLLAVLALVLMALGTYYGIRYFRNKKNGVPVAPEPAHIVALRKLDKLRGNKYWVPEKQKAYYSGITDTLREYIASRYQFGAMEMTTAEIFKAIKETEFPQEYKEPLKELFETSDFVKFAKMTVDDDYNAKALPLAVRFVTDTYQEEIENNVL